MKALADKKVADDTLTVFSSDNGYFLGERGLIHKWLMYEESIRVPLIVHYPRLAKSGQKLEAMALNIDVAPTFLDFAGVPIPKGTDGRSLRPLLEGKAPRLAQPLVLRAPLPRPRVEGGGDPADRGVRTSEWKYITYIDEKEPFEELYDLKNDPHEETNLVSDRSTRQRLGIMKAMYADYVKKLPPPVLPREKKK